MRYALGYMPSYFSLFFGSCSAKGNHSADLDAYGYNQAGQRTNVVRTAGERELDTPTKARVMPVKIKRWNGFSATNATQGSKDCLHQTEPPNALPASWRCPGQPVGVVGDPFNSEHPVRFRSWRRPSRLCHREV